MMRRLDDDQLCFVCRRRACGLATGGAGHKPRLGWLCEDCSDGLYGARAYAMSDRQFDEYEQRALLRAGEQAGAYLDRIGRTDLAALAPEEWRAFLGLVVTRFGGAIREEVGRGAVQGWVAEYAHQTTDEIEQEDAA